ncbi:hypothetical protein BAU15_05535 [Enterococcus sp. JM4C]|uniref:ABC transporter substrate-binding protein n=1 Tax=Candidatus Enterococcus huntleyi TaxID=1857217 RepID=UPI00137A93F8|nr:ABC transporter substrate-binding protein [Enterococcus sp. JM4C]KAF1295212.1 hypothetical protein BAU15_05535 [Enterococcus sp. JM4C]
MKKFLVAASLLALFSLAACGNTDDKTKDSGSASADKDTEKVVKLSVGVMPSTDNIPFILAHQQGFDKKYGVDIDIQAFKSAKDRDAAFLAGKVDAINTDLVAMAIYQQGGQDVKITSSTYGQFDLVTGDDSVKELADIKGKEIVLGKNGGTEYAVTEMLATIGMKEADVTITDVPAVPSRVELIKSGQVSAAILPEPLVTIAKADGMRVLGSTRDIGINPFVIGAQAKTIDEKSAAFEGMYKAYNEAVEYIKSHDKEEYIQLFIDEIGFPETLKDQITIPDYTPAAQATEADITAAFAWAKDKELLEKDLTPQDVLSDVFFK